MVGGNAGWRQGLQDHAAGDQLIRLVVAELQARTAAAIRVDQLTGSVGDAAGRFVARLEPLAQAVAHQPRVAWPALVTREVSRWCNAIDTVGQPHLIPSRLRVRPVTHDESTGTVTKPAFRPPVSPRWEIVVDYACLLIRPRADNLGPQLWRTATRNTIDHAVAGAAVLQGRLPSATGKDGARELRVLSGPYAGSLLLDSDALAAVAGVSNLERWRLWLVSGSLLLLAELGLDNNHNEQEEQVVESLAHFVSLAGNRMQPIPVTIETGRRPQSALRGPQDHPEPPLIR